MEATARIPIGSTATKTESVTRELTVAHFHPSMPEVYGTPMMIYLMEVTASEAIDQFLPAGWTTVGALVNVKHLAATPVGFTVTATAKVLSVSENMITCSVEAHDGSEKIGEGVHVRAAIELERFERRLKRKSGKDKDAGK